MRDERYGTRRGEAQKEVAAVPSYREWSGAGADAIHIEKLCVPAAVCGMRRRYAGQGL